MAEEKKNAVLDFFKGIRKEFNKIIWPTKEDLVKQTIAVVATSLALGLVIAGLDWIFQILFSFII